MSSSPFLERPHEPQVFVDPSGRRERRVRAALLAAVSAAVVWLGCLGAGCFGFENLPAFVPLHVSVLNHPRAAQRAHAVAIVDRRDRVADRRADPS